VRLRHRSLDIFYFFPMSHHLMNKQTFTPSALLCTLHCLRCLLTYTKLHLFRAFKTGKGVIQNLKNHLVGRVCGLSRQGEEFCPWEEEFLLGGRIPKNKGNELLNFDFLAHRLLEIDQRCALEQFIGLDKFYIVLAYDFLAHA